MMPHQNTYFQMLSALRAVRLYARPANWAEIDEKYREQSHLAKIAWELVDAAIRKASRRHLQRLRKRGKA